MKRGAGAAERAVELRPEQERAGHEDQAGNNRDDDRVKKQRVGIVAAPGTNGAGDRGGNAAADAAVRHHLHQHEHGEDQRDAGECFCAEETHVKSLGDADERLRDQHRDGRHGKAQHGRQDRPFEHRLANGKPALGGGGLRPRHADRNGTGLSLHIQPFLPLREISCICSYPPRQFDGIAKPTHGSYVDGHETTG